jgi:ribosomal protein L21/energy-coupling factor transporter ATP-binding protein EcfA2
MPRQLESRNHQLIREQGLIAHSNFQLTYNVGFRTLQSVNEGRIFFLVGPSRCGKSELLRALIKELLSGIHPRNDDDVPIVLVEADLSDRQRMDLKELMIDALIALRHPSFTENGNSLEDDERRKSRITEKTIRRMFKKSLKWRGTIYLFVDEAHHLLRTNRGELIVDILDSLKNLCNQAGVVLCLFGGYQLLHGLSFSAHFDGRVEVVHFAPYGTSAKDVESFEAILATYERLLPLCEEDLLTKNLRLLRELSWGACGAVVDLLRQAESLRIASKSAAIELNHICEAALREPALEVIREDIRFGLDYFSQKFVLPVASSDEQTRKVDSGEKRRKEKSRGKFGHRKQAVRRSASSITVK